MPNKKGNADTDIGSFRLQYQRQKKLEEIVGARALNRPKTKKWQVWAAFSELLLMAGAIVLICFLEISLPYQIAAGVLSAVLIAESYLRFCCIQAIRCYQHYAAEATRRRCKCIPSCSEYAILALKRVFPLILAFLKIRKRLFCTCDGEEYKVDFPCKKMGEKFESGI